MFDILFTFWQGHYVTLINNYIEDFLLVICLKTDFWQKKDFMPSQIFP